MYFSGESNVPGAPGNLFANNPSFDINRRPGSIGGRSGEQLKRLYEGGTKQNDKLNEELKNRGIMPRGVNLPFAMGLDASPMIAQSYPGGQAVGNVGAMTGGSAALGGGMGMGGSYGPRPLNLDINAVDDRIESIGGSANINLDENQRLRLGGTFTPAMTDPMGMSIPQGYQVYGAYETPGFGVNVNYRNTGRSGGFPGQINAGFQGRF